MYLDNCCYECSKWLSDLLAVNQIRYLWKNDIHFYLFKKYFRCWTEYDILFSLFLVKSSSLTVKKMPELSMKATAVQFRSYFINKYVNIDIGL